MIKRRKKPTDATVARVYGAALTVAADAERAGEATVQVFASAPHADVSRLVARALQLALRAAPAAPFAAMAPADAEAVAVTKYSGLDEAGAAAFLGVSTGELRRRLVSGLRALRPEPACA